MGKRVKAKCLDCEQRFEDEIGEDEPNTTYRCQKCGEKKVVMLKTEKNEIPKNCEKCGGVLGPNLPVCPRCFSSNVKILKYIKSTTKE